MRRIRQLGPSFLPGLLLFATSVLTHAESGYLVVHVKDVQGRPVPGLQIGVTGDGGSPTTGDDGKARIPLAKQTRENDWVTLQIVKSPPGKDFMMVSPWDYGTFVPSFANESKNVVEIVVVQRGDRVALVSGTTLKALAEQINKANAPGAQQNHVVSLTEPLTTSDSLNPRPNAPRLPKEKTRHTAEQEKQAALADAASSFGIPPEEIDKAIRAWGARATDPYEAGLAALYERNYPKASEQLADSLQKREEKLATDQKAVADAASFLGYSLSEEGRFKDAVKAYQRYLQLRPDDTTVMNNMGRSLMGAGDYTSAETVYRQALAIDEKEPGSNHLFESNDLNNLGALLMLEGNEAGAEPLLRRALAIREKALGSDHHDVAVVLNNLGQILRNKRDYDAAESLFRRALAIHERLNPDSRDSALVLTALALTLNDKRDYDNAEPLLRRALASDERALGPDNTIVAAVLNGLATLLRNKGDCASAEPLFRRALAIDETALGPRHPVTQEIRHNLESLPQKGSAQKSEK